MSVDWRTRLRELPVFDTLMPSFDPDAAPADPMELAADWLELAIASGEPQPHAAVWTTVDADGAPSSRTLILKDLTPEGFWCATSSATALGVDVARDPRAALHLYWPRLGRQLRVLGDLLPGPQEVSAADWAARSAAARAGGEESTWTAYVLLPCAIEFFAASADRGHLRARFSRDETGWQRVMPGVTSTTGRLGAVDEQPEVPGRPKGDETSTTGQVGAEGEQPEVPSTRFERATSSSGGKRSIH